MSVFKRSWVGVAIGIVGLAAGTLITGPALAESGTVRLAITSQSLIYTPLYVAQRMGLFDKHGVKVEILDAGGGTKVAAGLAGGSITAAAMAIDHVFAGTTQDQKWVMFGQLMNKEPYTFAMRNDVAAARNITAASSYEDRLKALLGTTIAVSTLGSGTQLALASAMAASGVPPEKSKWVPIGDPMAMVMALEHKQVEVAGRAPGPAEIAADRGSAMMVVDFSKDQVGASYPTIVLATTAAQLKDRADDLRNMSMALREALEITRTRPDDAAAAIRNDFKVMDEKSFREGMAFEMRSLPADLLITRQDFAAAVAHNNGPYLLSMRRGAKVSDNFGEAVDVEIAAK